MKEILVLTKVDEILAQLNDKGELTATELAHLTGEPRSSVYRILTNLREMGILERGVAQGTVRLGLRLLALGASVQARFEERQAALQVMERVHGETGESVFLFVRRNFDAVCVERLDGRFVQISLYRVGAAVPLDHGGGPRAILAFEADDTRREYLDQATFEALTPKTIVKRATLEKELAKIRRDGLSVSDEELSVGIATLAAPFFDFGGRVRGALAVAGVRPRMVGAEGADIRRLLVDGAEEVSRALGYELRAEIEPLRARR